MVIHRMRLRRRRVQILLPALPALGEAAPDEMHERIAAALAHVRIGLQVALAAEAGARVTALAPAAMDVMD